MKKDKIAELLLHFEALVSVEQGIEFWLARDLQALLEYERWENFAALLDRARIACGTAGQRVSDHFRDVTKMVRLGSGAERAVADVAMTRYGCYLLARRGPEQAIAFARPTSRFGAIEQTARSRSGSRSGVGGCRR
ncbi:MAG: hypothetical protein IPK26_13015 [Planctomycetes bacterium]|nr:hypothetical protein [Planctomycetota bacterium]